MLSLSTLTSSQMIWSRCLSLVSLRDQLRSLGWFSHTSHQSKHNRTKGQTRSLLQSSWVVENLILLHKHVCERDGERWAELVFAFEFLQIMKMFKDIMNLKNLYAKLKSFSGKYLQCCIIYQALGTISSFYIFI